MVTDSDAIELFIGKLLTKGKQLEEIADYEANTERLIEDEAIQVAQTLRRIADKLTPRRNYVY